MSGVALAPVARRGIALRRAARAYLTRSGLVAAARVPTRLGWTLIALTIACAALGLPLSWVELRMMAWFFLAVLLASARYMFTSAYFAIEAPIEAERVAAGHEAVVRYTLRRLGRRRRPVLLEVPIRRHGAVMALHSVTVPAGRRDDPTVVTVELPTSQRGVLTVGPVRMVLADPLELLRREVSWSASTEVIVHPEVVAIGGLGGGLIRDLEAQATHHRSLSDVAFHSLREFVTGDDLRHVHALTSARFGRAMVRQFVDTRSARLAVVVSARTADFATEEEFEIALSVGGSVAVRGVGDEQRVAVLVAGEHTPGRARQSSQAILDAFARARFGVGPGLVDACGQLHRLAPQTSIAVIVGGSATDIAALRSAADRFRPDTRVIAILVDRSAPISMARIRGLQVVRLPRLADLAMVFGRGTR